MEIEVTRAELDEVQSWLRVLSGAGKAEDGGAGEDAGSNEAAALAEYLESEGERGADVVAACKGVPVLVEVILEAENQRMLNALMGACVGVLPARKVSALRALVCIAQCDRHRGAVAGSGVLGIASAASVAAASPALLRALCFEAVGLLASDDDWETSAKAFDERRAAEFVKLRTQALSVGCVGAMVSCLVPSASPDGVRLCTAAASAIARLARSADVAPLLLTHNCLGKCLKLLQQRAAPASPPIFTTAAASSAAEASSEARGAAALEGEGDDRDDEGEEYDWSFACERPALKVLVGVLKQRPMVPPARGLPAVPSAAAGGTAAAAVADTAAAPSPSLCGAVATPALLDALERCLEVSAGPSRRSEAHALAADCLRRLAAARDSQGQPLSLCPPASAGSAAPGAGGASGAAAASVAAAPDVDATSSTCTAPETLPGVATAASTSVTGHLLVRSQRAASAGGGLLGAARRVITLAPAGAAGVVDLLAALCAADSAWQDAVAEAGLLKVLARAVQADDAVAPSAAGSRALPFSAPFSTRHAPARPTTLLGAWAVLLQAMHASPPNPASLSATTSAAATAVAIAVPGSARAACASAAASLAVLLAAPKAATRAQAVAAVQLLLAGRPPPLLAPPLLAPPLLAPPLLAPPLLRGPSDAAPVPPSAVGLVVGHFFVAAVASRAPPPAAASPQLACAPAALRAAAASYDLPLATRAAAAELLLLLDRALASEGWTAAAGQSSSSGGGGAAAGAAKAGKSKKRRGKGSASGTAVGGASAAGGASATASGGAAVAGSAAGPLAEALARQVRATAEAGAAASASAAGAAGAAAGVKGTGAAASAGEGAGLALKAAGNVLFGLRLWCDALAHYEAAGAALDDETEDEDAEDLREEAEGVGGEGVAAEVGPGGGGGGAGTSGSRASASSIGASGGGGRGAEGHDTRASLRVSLRLNAARCWLRLWDEPRCLAACAYAEAAALAAGARAAPEAAPAAVSPVLAHLKAQLWCQLGGSGWAAADGGGLPAKPWSERRQYLRRARDVLKSAGPTAPRASQKLLRETILALKAGPS